MRTSVSTPGPWNISLNCATASPALSLCRLEQSKGAAGREKRDFCAAGQLVAQELGDPAGQPAARSFWTGGGA